MGDIHITRELLEAIARGEIPVRVLEETIFEHLKKVCPYCRRELEEFAREQEAERTGKSPGPGFEAVSALLDRYLRDLRRNHDRAQRDVRELLTLPRDERTARIQRSRTRYRGPQIVWVLLQESRTLVTASPDEAEHLAELARLVVQYSPGGPGSMDLLALTTAHMANACRAAVKFAEADRHFEYVRSLITHQGVTDTEILARIDHLEGSLRMNQNRFKEAEKLLSRAAMLFSAAGEIVERSRTLIKLGYMYFLNGELVRAVETTRAGCWTFLATRSTSTCAADTTWLASSRSQANTRRRPRSCRRTRSCTGSSRSRGRSSGSSGCAARLRRAAETKRPRSSGSSPPGPASSDNGTPTMRPWSRWKTWL